MKVLHRSFRTADFEACWKLMATRHTLGAGGKQAFANGWKELLENEAMRGSVIVDLDVPGGEIISFGLSVFVREIWLRNYLAKPEPYALASLVAGHKRPDSPILRERGIALLNAGTGLTMLVVHHGSLWPPGSRPFVEVGSALIEAFQREHRGFNIREMAQEVYGEVARDFAAQGDNWKLCTDFLDYFTRSPVPLPDREDHPYLMSALRGTHSAASVLWSMLRFSPPFLGLSRQQRRVMKLATDGARRPQIAAELDLTPESIRNSMRAALCKAKEHPRTADLFRDAVGQDLPLQTQFEVLLKFLAQSREELSPWPRRA